MKPARVYLRKPTARDREEFLAASARSGKLHRSWVKPPGDAESFAKYLDRLRLEDHAGFLVCRTEDRAIVGVINLNQIVRGLLCSAYVGYYCFAPFARGGYMTDGLKLVLREAFVRMKLHRLEANMQPANRASVALAKRCGFRKEGFSPRYLKIAGRWRDHERWAITIEDWRKRR